MPVRRVLAGISLLTSAAVTAAPFLPWVRVSQQAFLWIPAKSQSWTALDELPEIDNTAGYLALAAGVIGCALALAALVTGRKPLGIAGIVPGILGLASCALFVQQLQAYQDKVKNDVFARLAQAVLDIQGGLAVGWYLALACSVAMLLCSAGQMLRKV